jgi:hypothetical protein
MRKQVVLAGLLVCSVSFSGCALTRVLSAPDPEFLELLEQQRQQELTRSLHQQAIEAHEHAVRMHQEMMAWHQPPASEPTVP